MAIKWKRGVPWALLALAGLLTAGASRAATACDLDCGTGLERFRPANGETDVPVDARLTFLWRPASDYRRATVAVCSGSGGFGESLPFDIVLTGLGAAPNPVYHVALVPRADWAANTTYAIRIRSEVATGDVSPALLRSTDPAACPGTPALPQAVFTTGSAQAAAPVAATRLQNSWYECLGDADGCMCGNYAYELAQFSAPIPAGVEICRRTSKSGVPDCWLEPVFDPRPTGGGGPADDGRALPWTLEIGRTLCGGNIDALANPSFEYCVNTLNYAGAKSGTVYDCTWLATARTRPGDTGGDTGETETDGTPTDDGGDPTAGSDGAINLDDTDGTGGVVDEDDGDEDSTFGCRAQTADSGLAAGLVVLVGLWALRTRRR
jgi:MYXO-CTERM domain-containing protein